MILKPEGLFVILKKVQQQCIHDPPLPTPAHTPRKITFKDRHAADVEGQLYISNYLALEVLGPRTPGSTALIQVVGGGATSGASGERVGKYRMLFTSLTWELEMFAMLKKA